MILRFTLLLILLNPLTLSSQCDHPDYDGLMAIYDSTNGTEWFSQNGWQEGKSGTACDPCNFNGNPWQFVTCNQGRVTGLYLSFNNLDGTFPDFELSELQELTVTDNEKLVGISSFSKTPKLKEITLTRTGLSGKLPDFRDAPQLELLNLNGNNYSSGIDELLLPNLEQLYLDANAFEGPLPNLDNFEKLTILNLQTNEFSGPIPDISLPNLSQLNLGTNQFTGELPVFENLPNLDFLILSHNLLEGTIHTFEANPKIKNISLNDNLFTGPVPDFKDHPNLTSLFFLASGNDLEGCYPESICDLLSISLVANYKLPFRGNAQNFCNSTSLVSVPCSENGQSELGIFNFQTCTCEAVGCDYYKADFDVLMAFYEATNGDNWNSNQGWRQGANGTQCSPCDYISFTGTWYGVKCSEGRVVAIDLDGSPTFTNIGVGGNNLNGDLQSLNLEKLKELYLDDNNLTGPLPAYTEATILENLVVSRNKLDGDLSVLQNLKNLKVFRGSYNNFEGSVPILSGIDSLQTFTCSHNMLTGCIDSSVCEIPLVDIRSNVMLPWEGDMDFLCDADLQIGAPCNILEEEEYAINEDCECVMKLETAADDIVNNAIICFPNPARQFVNVSGCDANSVFTIYNTHSQRVMTSQVSRIDVSRLPQGLYYIDVSGRSNVALKFLKI